MRKIYWRPRSVSRTALLLVAGASVAGLGAVEATRRDAQSKDYLVKVDAAERAQRAMERIREARLALQPPIDPETDPMESGLIGLRESPITTIAGDLTAKQTTVNPNFAAVIVDMLTQAGVEPGEFVAVGCSGSLPALNICVYAAIEAFGAQPIVIHSAGSSTYGANHPQLMWMDMERILAESGILRTRAIAVTYGGQGDQAKEFTREGLAMIDEAIKANGRTLLKVSSFDDSVRKRMQIYARHAGKYPVRCYINVGGGSVSVGRALAGQHFHAGLNLVRPPRLGDDEGVMPRFARQGVPVIHLQNITRLAERYGLPVAPQTMPPVPDPESAVYARRNYNRWLAGGMLALIVGGLYGFIRSDVGFRLLRVARKSQEPGHPEPMV